MFIPSYLRQQVVELAEEEEEIYEFKARNHLSLCNIQIHILFIYILTYIQGFVVGQIPAPEILKACSGSKDFIKRLRLQLNVTISFNK